MEQDNLAIDLKTGDYIVRHLNGKEMRIMAWQARQLKRSNAIKEIKVLFPDQWNGD